MKATPAVQSREALGRRGTPDFPQGLVDLFFLIHRRRQRLALSEQECHKEVGAGVGNTEGKEATKNHHA